MEIDSDYRPITVLPCVMDKKHVKFLTPERKLVIDGEWLKPTKKVLRFCNGCFSVADIATNLKIDEDFVVEVVEQLERCGAVVDSREQYRHFHRVSSFPTYFSHKRTQAELTNLHAEVFLRHGMPEERFAVTQDITLELQKALEKRKSCRNFTKEIVTLWQIIQLCRAGYSQVTKGHFSVPSAGGLYPLNIYVIKHRRCCNSVSPGYYIYNPGSDTLGCVNENVDLERLKYCFNNEEILDNSAQIVITANVDFMAYKYANRAYRFCLIEAGHVAQNITLAAAELGLGTCELGGVLDEAISEELELVDSELPMLAIAIGHPGNDKESFNYAEFIEESVGEDKPVKNVSIWNDGGDFYTATAEYDDENCLSVSAGKARSDIMAMFKAVVEGYERYALKQDPEVENSCGIAAHFSLEEAKKGALSELIERDAIMRCWEDKDTYDATFDRIKPLSQHTMRRVNELWKEGRDVSVLRLVSPEAPYIPVILVTITGNYYPYFVCGAACDVNITANNAKETLCRIEEKALMEAESALLFYLKNPESGKAPKLKDIKSPEDHGRLYRMSRKAAKKLCWLTEGEQIKYSAASIDFPNEHIAELDEKLKVSYRTIAAFDNNLIVVQARSPKLKQMLFGTNGEKVLPHFFA